MLYFSMTKRILTAVVTLLLAMLSAVVHAVIDTRPPPAVDDPPTDSDVRDISLAAFGLRPLAENNDGGFMSHMLAFIAVLVMIFRR
jgi:hypothetical protein